MNSHVRFYAATLILLVDLFGTPHDAFARLSGRPQSDEKVAAWGRTPDREGYSLSLRYVRATPDATPDIPAGYRLSAELSVESASQPRRPYLVHRLRLMSIVDDVGLDLPCAYCGVWSREWPSLGRDTAYGSSGDLFALRLAQVRDVPVGLSLVAGEVEIVDGLESRDIEFELDETAVWRPLDKCPSISVLVAKPVLSSDPSAGWIVARTFGDPGAPDAMSQFIVGAMTEYSDSRMLECRSENLEPFVQLADGMLIRRRIERRGDLTQPVRGRLSVITKARRVTVPFRFEGVPLRGRPVAAVPAKDSRSPSPSSKALPRWRWERDGYMLTAGSSPDRLVSRRLLGLGPIKGLRRYKSN